MYYTIYKITNIINGKIYIGKHQTLDLSDDYMGSGVYLMKSIKKYGLENFKKDILFVYDNEKDMNQKEKELVTTDFCLQENTYNLCEGGHGGFGFINRNNLNIYENHKEISRLNIAKGRPALTHKLKTDNAYKKWYSEHMSKCKKEYFETHPGTFSGKSHSTATKEKIGLKTSITQSGQKNSQFGSMWITNGHLNKKIKFTDIIPDGWRKGRVT